MNPLVEKALRFSSVRHNGQFRKGSSIPYLSHPFSVAMLLEHDHQPPSVVAAGLLHDVLEDTATDPNEILLYFGPEVTRLVLAVSEPDKHLSWETRKKETIQRINTLQFDEIALLAADKLHNVRSIRSDLEVEGTAVWQRFARPLRDQSWYYHEILRALRPFKGTTDLIELYEQELDLLFYGKENEQARKVSKLIESMYSGFNEEEWLQESATLCQTAYELRQIVERVKVEDEETGQFSLQLTRAGLHANVSPSLLAGLQELSHRTALRPYEIVPLMSQSIVN